MFWKTFFETLSMFHVECVNGKRLNETQRSRPHNRPPPCRWHLWFTLIAYYSTILSHLDRGEEDAKLSILECARVR